MSTRPLELCDHLFWRTTWCPCTCISLPASTGHEAGRSILGILLDLLLRTINNSICNELNLTFEIITPHCVSWNIMIYINDNCNCVSVWWTSSMSSHLSSSMDHQNTELSWLENTSSTSDFFQDIFSSQMKIMLLHQSHLQRYCRGRINKIHKRAWLQYFFGIKRKDIWVSYLDGISVFRLH